MDSSKEYIEMCAKSEEIQAHNKSFGYINGDCYWRQSIEKWFIVQINVAPDKNDLDHMTRPWLGKDIWMPRQDQLQSLCKDFSEVHIEMKEDVGQGKYIIFWTANGVEEIANSFEQMWLQLAMRQYRKEWSVKDREWKLMNEKEK